MNILFLTDLLPTGGSRTFLINAAKQLRKEGHQLFLIGFAELADADFPFELFTQPNMIYVKNLRPKIFSERFSPLYSALKTLLQKQHIDCILIDLLYPASSFLFLRPLFAPQLKNTRIIYQFHGLDSLERIYQDGEEQTFSVKNSLRKLKVSVRLGFERWVLNTLPDKIVVFSTYADKLLKDAGVRTPSQLIKPGMDSALEKAVSRTTKQQARKILGLSQDLKVVIIPSRLEPRKGVLSFFHNLSQKEKQDKKLKFLVVSDFWNDGYTYDFFQALAVNQLGIKVLCFPKPSRAELALLYRAADVTLIPSIDLETFGFVSLESMRLGTPIVGYNIGANAEVIDKKLLAKQGSQEQLLKIVHKTLNMTSPQRKKLQNTVVQSTKTYNWAEYTKLFSNF
jgi:glycosyltransferase involved in cell wall biosynthesis